MTDATAPRTLVIIAAEQAATLVAHEQIAQQWDEPSALADMTVGGLAAHLVRATGAVLAYLDRTDPDTQPDGELLTPVTYFHAALTAPIHDRIKEVSADEASAGHADVAERAADVAQKLADRLPHEPPDRMIGALGGRMLTLDDFCRTRMIETLMHIDDLAHSVGLPTPDMPADGTGEIIDILVGIARHAEGDWRVIHALGRSERLTTPVFPVF